MSERIQCDSCQLLFDRWHERIAVESQGEGPRNVAGARFVAINGDYCSILCLARKMQAAHPGARDEMLEALNMGQPEPRELAPGEVVARVADLMADSIRIVIEPHQDWSFGINGLLAVRRIEFP